MPDGSSQGSGSTNVTDEVDKLTFHEKGKLTLKAGDSYEINFSIPDDADYDDVEWRSEDEDVAEVSPTGKITAWAEGTITIAAKLGDTICSIELTVTEDDVPDEDEDEESGSSGENINGDGLEIDAPDTMKVGDTIRLTAYLDGEECDDVEWFMYEYSQKYASITSGGKLTAKKAAPITVWAQLLNGEKVSREITITN